MESLAGGWSIFWLLGVFSGSGIDGVMSSVLVFCAGIEEFLFGDRRG